MKRIWTILLSSTLLTTSMAIAYENPDGKLTPGEKCTANDSYFDQFKYSPKVAICKRHVTKAMKEQISDDYGVEEADWSDYEFDHLIPLCAGGSTGLRNLWPQPIDEAHDKDKIEDQVCTGLRKGTMTQAQAVKKVHDWFKSRHPEWLEEIAAHSW